MVGRDHPRRIDAAPAANRAGSIAVALAVDALFGEPPSRFHPVAWLGSTIAFGGSFEPSQARSALLYGASLTCAVVGGAATVGRCTERALRGRSLPTQAVLLGLALKPAFAMRGLLDAGKALEVSLVQGDLPAARGAARALVSRDTTALSAELLAAAAIESLAENLTDSIVAPLLAWSLSGLPGVYAYRAINTLDSMIGYRGRYEWLGKAAARLDDAANFVPARLSALVLIAAAGLLGEHPAGAARAALRDHRLTASPNAGWTMSAVAGALDVRLEKAGHYVLNAGGRRPDPADIARARSLVRAGALGAAVMACLLCRGLRR